MGREKTDIRVLACDEQAVVRVGIKTLLNAERGIEIVGEVGEGRRALDIARSLDPDVVITDIRLPDVDGIRLTEQLARPDTEPTADVIVLTDAQEADVALEALGAGARGFVFKRDSSHHIVHAVRAVASGDAWLVPKVTGLMLDRFSAQLSGRLIRAPGDVATLTEREREVLGLIAAGSSGAEVAAKLSVSEATVKSHVHHVLQKLGLRNRVEAALIAYQAGLVDRTP